MHELLSAGYLASPAVTHHLVFHAGKDDIQHLGKCGLGGGLIDEVFAGQIDIVACPYCLQDSALMDFNVWGRHSSQKSLRQQKWSPSRMPISPWPNLSRIVEVS